MREIDLKEMQQIELDILLEFDALCKKHQLRYYLGGGTLAGAMCYEGFIPWDDDIDLKMPRPDYERLITLTGELPAHIRLDVPSREQCDHLFAKLTDCRTLLIENPGPEEKRSGVYVDIFPMDGYPEAQGAREAQLRKLSRLNTLFHHSLNRFAAMRNAPGLKTRLKGLLYGLLYTPYRLYRKLTRLATRCDYEESTDAGLLIEGDPVKECFPKTWLEPAAMLEFEGHTFPAPAGYKEHLALFYGSYITEEKYYHNLPQFPSAHRYVVFWKDGSDE